jgi:hydrogenase/urease accessory protein HupE
MNKSKKNVALLLMLVSAGVVEAHPALVDSPHLLDGIIHFFSSADHLLTFVAVGVGLVYLVRRLNLQRNR